MKTYRSDPGGNFPSDPHRRVMAALANPDEEHLTLEELMFRLDQDDHVHLEHDEALKILAELETVGDATRSKNGWKNTKAGFEVLTGPPSSDGGRSHE